MAANLSSQLNQASIGGTVTAPSITVHAFVGGDGITTYTAEAVSGGGSATFGIAGAFAVNYSNPGLPPLNFPQTPQLPANFNGIPLPTILLPSLPNIPGTTGGQNSAIVQSGAALTLLNGGDLQVQSNYVGHYTATSTSGPEVTATVGVGPSVAANAMTEQVRRRSRTRRSAVPGWSGRRGATST